MACCSDVWRTESICSLAIENSYLSCRHHHLRWLLNIVVVLMVTSDLFLVKVNNFTLGNRLHSRIVQLLAGKCPK